MVPSRDDRRTGAAATTRRSCRERGDGRRGRPDVRGGLRQERPRRRRTSACTSTPGAPSPGRGPPPRGGLSARHRRTDGTLVATVAETCPAMASAGKAGRAALKTGAGRQGTRPALANEPGADAGRLPSRYLREAGSPYPWPGAAYARSGREGRAAPAAVAAAIGCDERGRWHVQPGVRDVREALPQGPPASPGRPGRTRSPAPASRSRTGGACARTTCGGAPTGRPSAGWGGPGPPLGGGTRAPGRSRLVRAGQGAGRVAPLLRGQDGRALRGRARYRPAERGTRAGGSSSWPGGPRKWHGETDLVLLPATIRVHVRGAEACQGALSLAKTIFLDTTVMMPIVACDHSNRDDTWVSHVILTEKGRKRTATYDGRRYLSTPS